MFVNHFPFHGLDLNRNAAKVSESWKINDPRMTKLFFVIFFWVATAREPTKHMHATSRPAPPPVLEWIFNGLPVHVG